MTGTYEKRPRPYRAVKPYLQDVPGNGGMYAWMMVAPFNSMDSKVLCSGFKAMR